MKVLTDKNLAIRISSLWLTGLSLLFIAWTLSYIGLPEGSVRGGVVVAYIPLITEEVNSTFIRIFTYNLLLATASILIANLITIKTFPLGYLPLFYHWTLYGVFLGTNSFMIPSATKLIPSLITLFRGSGIYEVTSYTLIAAATCNIGIPIEFVTKMESRKGVITVLKSRYSRLTRWERVTMLAAIVLLMISNYLEAWQIFHG